MTSDKFNRCIGFVLQHENAYDKAGNVICEHDPRDSGGATKYGVDQSSHPHIDVCHLTEQDAKQIYFDGEWTRCRCEQLPIHFDLAMLDTAVNCGMGTATKMLQKALGVTVDGIIGNLTLTAAATASHAVLGAFLAAREAYYNKLPKKLRDTYLKGWLARVKDLRKAVEL